LRETIEQLFAAGAAADKGEAREAFARLRQALDVGEVRAAEPDAAEPTGWRVNAWVKQGILLGFRHGDIVDLSAGLPFYDKDTMPLKQPGAGAGIRIVPGGSSVREGAYLAPGVICMPPMYINVGAYIGHAHRLACPRRIVRAGRRAGARERRGSTGRRHRAGRRPAGHRRRRCPGGREYGHLRGRGHQAPRRDRGRHHPYGIDSGVRPAE
jgi:hypothetical protein